MLKRILFLFSFCMLTAVAVKSQSYKFIYYLDTDLNTVSKKKASIIGKGLKGNKLVKLDCFSAFSNALLMTIHFADSSLAVLQGSFRSYHLNGKIEKEGNHVMGFEEGTWQSWDTLGRKVDSVIYKNGLPYVHATFDHHKNGSLRYYSIEDSLQQTYQTVTYDENAGVTHEVFFKGQKGILKTYTEKGVQTDSLFTREESEASFPGGEQGWRTYLKENLNPNTPVDNNAGAGKYTVVIKFIVTKDGSLNDVSAETSHGHGMEKEVIRIIKNGPKWIPAVQYGRKVNAYRRQPVTFVVEK